MGRFAVRRLGCAFNPNAFGVGIGRHVSPAESSDVSPHSNKSPRLRRGLVTDPIACGSGSSSGVKLPDPLAHLSKLIRPRIEYIDAERGKI